MKTTTHYKGHRWTTSDLRTLMQLWASGESLNSISAQLTSTPSAVLKMVQRMRSNGVPLERRTNGNKFGHQAKNWTQGEVEYLLRKRTEKATADEIGVNLGRSASAVSAMIQKLRSEDVPVAMLGQGVRRLWNVDSLKVLALSSPDSRVIELDAKKSA